MGAKSKAKKNLKAKSEGYLRDFVPPVDTIHVKIISLRMPGMSDPPPHVVKVSFCGQMVLSAIVKPLGIHQESDKAVAARGFFSYDPSDYEKMCIFANEPLTVEMGPENMFPDPENLPSPISMPSSPALTDRKETKDKKDKKNKNEKPSSGKKDTGGQTERAACKSATSSEPSKKQPFKHMKACNIDILPLLLGEDKMCVTKRLQPMLAPRALERTSWDLLPLMVISLSVSRNEDNQMHHLMLKAANWVKITMIGAYNMRTPYNADQYYTVATKIPTCTHNCTTKMEIFQEGIPYPRNFNPTNFYPRWENLRRYEQPFIKADEKLVYNINEVQNSTDIDLKMYFNGSQTHSVIWGTFHRSLLLGDYQFFLQQLLRKWKWPLELHHYGELVGGHSFMGFLDLFQMLSPGVKRLVLAVPLHWYNPQLMMDMAGCRVMMLPVPQDLGGITTPKIKSEKGNKSGKSTPNTISAKSSLTSETMKSSTTATPKSAGNLLQHTGLDGNAAFVMIVIELAQPLVPVVNPEHITPQDLKDMLSKMAPGQGKRHCVGRGQLEDQWLHTVQAAADALNRVPFHGDKAVCNFDRQLAVTMTRVAILTSFTLDAAIFVNNNFLVQDFLGDEESYEKHLRLAHACIMNFTISSLVTEDRKVDITLRAARNARQLCDTEHAVELYLQAVVQNQFEPKYWRELSTCLKDVHMEWAAVCLNKSISLDYRASLTLLSKACMVFEKDPESAECFFQALLYNYPEWSLGYVIYSAYCTAIQNYNLADAAFKSYEMIQRERIAQEVLPRVGWEQELGDFWEPTLLLPTTTSPFCFAADLLLRIRSIQLAEVCLAIALTRCGEKPEYFHLTALCSFLREDYQNALCLINKGIAMFGQVDKFVPDRPAGSQTLEEGTRFVRCKRVTRHSLTVTDTLTCCLVPPNNTYLRCLEGHCLHQLGDTSAALAAYDKVRGGTCAHSILMSLASFDKSRVRSVLLDLIRRQPSAYAWIALAHHWLASADSKFSDRENAREATIACAVQALKCDRRAGGAWALLAKIVKPSKRKTFCANMAAVCGVDWSSDELSELRSRSSNSACNTLGTHYQVCSCAMCAPLRR